MLVRDLEGLLNAKIIMTMSAILLALSAIFLPGASARTESHGRSMQPAGPQSGALAPMGEVSDDSVAADPGYGTLSALMNETTWDQVRIEQRLIIRISPRTAGSSPMREALAPPIVLRERRAEKCLAVPTIFGVKPVSNSRLVLFTRDRRLFGADLDKSCNAQDFYSGFYLESAADGRLCVKRDTIHSRAGTSCTIARLRELEP